MYNLPCWTEQNLQVLILRRKSPLCGPHGEKKPWTMLSGPQESFRMVQLQKSEVLGCLWMVWGFSPWILALVPYHRVGRAEPLGGTSLPSAAENRALSGFTPNPNGAVCRCLPGQPEGLWGGPGWAAASVLRWSSGMLLVRRRERPPQNTGVPWLQTPAVPTLSKLASGFSQLTYFLPVATVTVVVTFVASRSVPRSVLVLTCCPSLRFSCAQPVGTCPLGFRLLLPCQ